MGDVLYKIRSCFIAPPGHVIVDADFKSAELLALGRLSNCAKLVADVPGDLHARGCVTAMGAPPWEGFDNRVPPPKWWLDTYKSLRIGRKTVNFGQKLTCKVA